MELADFTTFLLPYPNKELKKACSEFGSGQSSIRADLVFSLWTKAEDNLDLANDIITFLSERQEASEVLTKSQEARKESNAIERERLKLEMEKVALEKLKEQNALNKPPEALAHEIRLAELENERQVRLAEQDSEKAPRLAVLEREKLSQLAEQTERLAEIARAEKLESLRLTTDSDLAAKRMEVELASVQPSSVNVPHHSNPTINIKNYIA